MSSFSQSGRPDNRVRPRGSPAHYRELLRRTLTRQVLLYFLPLLLLAVFFNVNYRSLVARTTQAHLSVIAENQAATLDLFLRERLVNLANLIDDPVLRDALGPDAPLSEALVRLRHTSAAFVDLGLVNGGGQLLAYRGPVHFDGPICYESEPWFRELMDGQSDSVITNIYLGFRGQPHFTIAVRRQVEGQTWVLRSALSPESIEAYLTTLEGANEVHAAVVNADGVFQIAPRETSPLAQSHFRPPRDPARGYVQAGDDDGEVDYGYAWLSQTPWALVVSPADGAGGSAAFFAMPRNVMLGTLALFILMGAVILIRARQLVTQQVRAEQHEQELSGQLVHAAKLAAVGQLAAGVAHEINNPLAIIAEEVGLLKDAMDPELSDDEDDVDLNEALDIIHDAVFRCRDITRKLLTFVRQTDVRFAAHHIHEILDDVVGGMLGNELTLSNIAVIRDYDDGVQEMVTDRNRLTQVFVNLVKNAADAMPEGGTLMVRTRHDGDRVIVRIKDTGCGMTPEQMEKVFLPFFTTKESGAGTGLGLSISSTIVESLGGRIYAESLVGRGSAFTVELPYAVEG